MLRLLKIVLLTAIAVMGGLLADLGVRVWFVAHRTTETIFDVGSSSDIDAPRFDYPSAWFDTGYISQRAGAVIILLIGMVMSVWAVQEIFRKQLVQQPAKELKPAK